MSSPLLYLFLLVFVYLFTMVNADYLLMWYATALRTVAVCPISGSLMLSTVDLCFMVEWYTVQSLYYQWYHQLNCSVSPLKYPAGIYRTKHFLVMFQWSNIQELIVNANIIYIFCKWSLSVSVVLCVKNNMCVPFIFCLASSKIDHSVV